MKLLVISSAPFIQNNDAFFAYAPYVKELEIWRRNADEIHFCCPFWSTSRGLLIAEIPFKIHKIHRSFDFEFTSLLKILVAIPKVIGNLFILFYAISKADAIHLRCPGNLSLLACLVQIFFPNKIKTAKYAGNWDPNAVQPWSYKIQKRILSSTFFTRNMTVLVYGEWKNQSKNIKSFFTATYSKDEIFEIENKSLQFEIKFLFVGTLSHGKQPMYALQIVHELLKNKKNVLLTFCGEGDERTRLSDYIIDNQLEKFVSVVGNKTKEQMKFYYQQCNFLILPSKSEGWPKVVAEAMIWKCLPIATAVSCVKTMLDQDNRGLILTMNIDDDIKKILELIESEPKYFKKTNLAFDWSKQYTTDFFESEIKLLLQKKSF